MIPWQTCGGWGCLSVEDGHRLAKPIIVEATKRIKINNLNNSLNDYES